MTQEVKKALYHVRNYHPDITTVIFNKDCMWLYLTDNFERAIFGNEIDVSILEQAADSLDIFPVIFQL